MEDVVVVVDRSGLISIQVPVIQKERDFLKIKEMVKINVEKSHAKLQLTKNHSINGVLMSTNHILVEFIVKTNKKTGEKQEFLVSKGIIKKTARFRGLADFQSSSYDLKSSKYQDPIEEYVESMKNLDFEKIKEYPPFDNRLTLPIVPPPRFTPLTWITKYEYKESSYNSLIYEQDPIKGEKIIIKNNLKEIKKLGLIMAKINSPEIPEISKTLEKLPTKNQKSNSPLGKIKKMVEKLERLFDQRPVCTKAYLAKQLNVSTMDKILARALPYVTYYYQKGPWRHTHVKFGIDPRKDRNLRVYQTLEIRVGKGTNYQFDGTDNDIVNSLQLIDIVKPDFQKRIKSLVFCRAVFDNTLGWYVDGHLDQIRKDIKAYFVQLRGIEVEVEDEVEEDSDEDEQEPEETEMQMFLRQLQDDGINY
jgi:hypothetical protein